MPQCTFIRPDNGERCGNAIEVNPANGRCIWHDETRAEQRRKIQSKGAQATNSKRSKNFVRTVKPDEAPPAPETLEDCVSWASWLAVAVVTGVIDARTCKEPTNSVRELRSSLEKRDLEREIGELRRQLNEVRRPKAVG